jgi:hypothetical protein
MKEDLNVPPLNYECILCHRVWGYRDIKEDELSSGICPECFRDNYVPLIHRRQLREGYNACFAQGYEDCTEFGCVFRFACLEINIEQWKETILREKE